MFTYTYYSQMPRIFSLYFNFLIFELFDFWIILLLDFSISHLLHIWTFRFLNDSLIGFYYFTYFWIFELLDSCIFPSEFPSQNKAERSANIFSCFLLVKVWIEKPDLCRVLAGQSSTDQFLVKNMRKGKAWRKKYSEFNSMR